MRSELLVLLIGGAAAFPSYRLAVPNGNRVECVDGLEGCVTGEVEDCLCQGLGHSTCKGGSLPLNAFGKAFKEEGFKWTLDLCSADSDGDGFSNGEELGDPCCMWMAHGIPSDYTSTFDVTHPGSAASKPRASYEAQSCAENKDMEPEEESVVLNEFNKGERERKWDFVIDGYEIPSKPTTYVWFVFNFDDDFADEYHAVYAEAIVSSAHTARAHHYIILGCNEKFPAEMHGKVISDGPTFQDEKCTQAWGGWAPGRDIVSTPPWAGHALGKNAGTLSFAVQVHYDNQQQLSGIISRDGFRIHYTPDVRNDYLSGFTVLQTSYAPDVIIPKGRERYFMTRTCNLEVEDSITGEPAEAELFAVGFHAHLLGTEMYARLFVGGTDGKEEDLGSARTWHFDDQAETVMLARKLKFKTGDMIQGTCIYDTRKSERDTPIDLETTDEMCWQTFQTWPGRVEVRCKEGVGKVWLGEVQRGESLDHIHETHPYTEAAAFWTPLTQDGCLSTFRGCPKTARIGAPPYNPALVPKPMSESGLACTVEPMDVSNAGHANEPAGRSVFILLTFVSVASNLL